MQDASTRPPLQDEKVRSVAIALSGDSRLSYCVYHKCRYANRKLCPEFPVGHLRTFITLAFSLVHCILNSSSWSNVAGIFIGLGDHTQVPGICIWTYQASIGAVRPSCIDYCLQSVQGHLRSARRKHHQATDYLHISAQNATPVN